MAKEIINGYIYIDNKDIVEIEEFISDWQDSPDINDDPEWLIDRVNDSILPFFKKILNTLA